MSLFRTEAVLALTKPLAGEPLIATPPGWRTWVALTIAFLILGTTTLLVIEMPRKEIASGMLVPVQGLNWAHAPTAGFVDGIHVQRGDVVKRGQPLVRISHDADVSGQSFAALNKALDGQSDVLNERIQLMQDQLCLLRREHQDQRQ